MKIYVASSFSLISKVEEVVEALEKVGHEITVKWWNRVYDTRDLGKIQTQELKKEFENLEPNEFYSRPETSKSFCADLQGIEDCEAFILVADEIPRNYGGANIELGYAMGCGKDCFSIGSLENSALYWDVKRCSSIDELIFEIGDVI